MALKGFTFYRTYCDVMDEMATEKEQKDLVFAIVRYLMYDEDLEEKLTKNVRIAFKCLKPNLKTSRSRSDSGKAGMESRYANKPITNGYQTPNKNLTSLSLSSSLSSRSSDAPAACGKCGGALSPTGAHKGPKSMYLCESCGEEVWS